MSVSKLPLFAVLAAGAAGAFVPGSAHAYVCTSVSDAGTGVTEAWNQRCVPYWVDRRGNKITGTKLRPVADRSFPPWTDNPCTDMQAVFVGYTGKGAEFDVAHPDQNQNVIVSVEPDDPLWQLFPSNVLAFTLVHYSVVTGEILDADIIMNMNTDLGIYATSAECQSEDPAGYDVESTLVHEIGHFFGFGHTPDPASTMYASSDHCSTSKRDLTDDDRLGMCTVYPKGKAVAPCTPPSGGYAANEAFHCQCYRATGDPTPGCGPAPDDSSCSCVTAPTSPEGSDGAPAGVYLIGGLFALSLLGLAVRRS